MSHYIDVIARFGWTQTCQVTIVALTMLLLVRLFCRNRPHLAYLLLLVVLAKCLVPPVLSVPWSVFGRSLASNTASIAYPSANTAARELGDYVSSTVNSRQSIGTNEPLAGRAASKNAFTTAPNASSRSHDRVKAVLVVLWMFGAAVVVMWVGKTWFSHLGSIKKTSHPADAQMVAMLREITGRIGLKRKIRLLVSSDSRRGPFCYGLIHPTIVVPRWLIADKSMKTVEQVLAHELIHIRRGDHLAALLQVIAVALWWFHPLVWSVSRGLSRERERCCDDEVIAGAGCEPGSYVQALLDVIKSQTSSGPSVLVTGIRSVELTKKRLERIMTARNRIHSQTPKSHWAVFIVMLSVVVPAGSAGAERWERRSPFRDVQLKDDRVEVEVEGKRYTLLAINGLPTEEILKASRKQFGKLWEKRFVEDLVEVMSGMGHKPGSTVTLRLSEVGSLKTLTLTDVPMTQDNRQAVYRAYNRRREGGADAPSAEAKLISNLVTHFVKSSEQGDAGQVSRLLVRERNTRNYIETTKKMLEANVELTQLGFIETTPDQAIAATDFFRFAEADQQGMYCVVYRCLRRDGEWLINDIDLENLDGFAREVVRFVDKNR